MKFAIESIVEHDRFGQGIVKMFSLSGISEQYTVLFGKNPQFTRTVKEKDLRVPYFKTVKQSGLPQFL